MTSYHTRRKHQADESHARNQRLLDQLEQNPHRVDTLSHVKPQGIKQRTPCNYRPIT